MRILALEFSTHLRSVALVEEGRVICRSQESQPQTSGPTQLIRDAFAQAGLGSSDIGCVVVGLGPGSYTGIRVAIAVAQGWELARQVKLLGVSSVECLVWRCWLEGRHGPITVLVDAQRGEYYAARYQVNSSGVETEVELAIHPPEVVAQWAEQGAVLVGPDLDEAPWPVTRLRPEAGMLGVLAWERTDFVTGADLQPIYLREVNFVKAPAPRAIPPV